MIFLGTPHQGSTAQPLGELITKCALAIGFPAEGALLEVLRTDSEALHELVHQFTAVVRQQSIPVKCFFEQRKTELGRRIPLLGSLVKLKNFDTMVCNVIQSNMV